MMNSSRRLVGVVMLGAMSLAIRARAAHPLVEDLAGHPLEALMSVENGSVEAAVVDGQPVWRWHIPAGQESTLALRPEHPLYDRLRYYDRLQFDFRIAGGEVSDIKFNAVGHVSGPRQYKVHNHRIAIVTTERGVWHPKELNLADAYWFPWDNPDGEGEQGYFRFSSLAIAHDTVVELRNIRLVRGLLYLKPDYQAPVTWPIQTRHDDGSVRCQLTYKVLNTSGQPTDITARIISEHQRFNVSLDKTSQAVKASAIATFTVTATINKEDMEASPELYCEPLRLQLSLSHRPRVTTLWEGVLVRPLSAHVRRQVMLAQADVELTRQAVADKDEPLLKLMGLEGIVRRADEFVAKTLHSPPRSYGHVRNSYPQPWAPGDIMSEAVNTQTGERQVGSTLAGAVWREYLGHSGQATYYTGLAYAITQDEKYARKAIELMSIYAQQYAERDWNVLFDVPFFPGTPIQGSSRMASNSSYGSNWDLKWFSMMASLVADSPSWTAEQRARIYQGFVVPYATELTKLHASISNQTDITNHNLLLLGLAFDDATMVWYATLRDCGLISRLRDIDEDGFSSEGRPLNYHHGAAAEYLPSITHLENSKLGIDYGKQRILEAIRMPYYRAALWGAVPNTGDCGRGQAVGSSALADLIIGIAPEQTWLADIGRDSTLAAKLHRYRTKQPAQVDGWKKLLDSKPHLFPAAGLAILRSGDSPETQIMATLDYGRSVFHSAKDRNQFTLLAFGKTFTHGPGTLYNAGSGGIRYNEDPRLKSFNDGRVSLAHNVLVVDQTSQLTCVGRLLAWSDQPDFQVAVSQVDGLSPGVSHTRGLVLTNGLIVIFDRVRSERTHTYDLVYHNFGRLSWGPGWQATPVDQPLGRTGNYENIVDPAKLTGAGLLHTTWDLTGQYPYWAENQKVDPTTLPPIKLALWRLPVEGGVLYSGITGLNNNNTWIISDETPTLIHRVQAENVDFITVLEPHKDQSRVLSVVPGPDNRVTVKLRDGNEIATSLDELLKKHQYPGGQ